jgi:ketosteroid isomerase-like protein
MPHENTVQAFIALVQAGDYIGALEQFYYPDASMQENNDPPRIGRDTLIQHERQVMSLFSNIVGKCDGEPLVRGDTVAIRWRFAFTAPDGGSLSLDEIALQTWRGDRIAEEKFFYDPKQLGR